MLIILFIVVGIPRRNNYPKDMFLLLLGDIGIQSNIYNHPGGNEVFGYFSKCWPIHLPPKFDSEFTCEESQKIAPLKERKEGRNYTPVN